MGAIFGLYSTFDGVIRYIERTEGAALNRFDLLVTKALDREAGVLCDWFRDQWRSGNEVRSHVLQEDIAEDDLQLFEAYWIEQFADLLNAAPRSDPVCPTSAVGQGIIGAIRAMLRGPKVR